MYIINNFRFKEKKVKELKKKVGRLYIKTASACFKTILSRSGSGSRKSLANKSYLAFFNGKSSTPLGKEQNHKNIDREPSLPKKPLNRNKLTEGPFAEVAQEKKKIYSKRKNEGYLNAIKTIQRFARSILFKKHILKSLSELISDLHKKQQDIIHTKQLVNFHSTKKKAITTHRTKEEMEKAKQKLFTALKAKYPIGLEYIIEECKFCVNLKDELGNTPLYYAVKSLRFGICEKLVQIGAKVTLKNECDNTALHISMKCNNRNISSLLISNGADLFAINKRGETPLNLSSRKLLEELGLSHVQINSQGKLNKSLLH